MRKTIFLLFVITIAVILSSGSGYWQRAIFTKNNQVLYTSATKENIETTNYNQAMEISIYTGDYTTNISMLVYYFKLDDLEKMAKITNYISKIKDKCADSEPSEISSLELSKFMDICVNCDIYTLYSQGHDYFYLFSSKDDIYYYLGEYYNENYYVPFREIVYDALALN